jgi:peptidoglycan hydrolase-like protein with peptidoglycan-binding domain
MSTTTSTPTTPTAKTSSTGRTALIAVGAAVAGAAVVAGLVFGLGGFGSSTTTNGAAPVVVPTGTAHHHVTPVTPVAPSQTIITLQRELGQLNYYEGPITGTMNEQTVQAITYLQRDAHLPQTGTMTPATQTALQHFLATGNNQMGGNS